MQVSNYLLPGKAVLELTGLWGLISGYELDCLRIRAFNIIRGDEFLRVLQLAAVEAFGDQALFPSEFLVNPKDLAAFARLNTIMRYEVQPLINKKEGLEIVTQMKMTPTPSPSMRRRHLHLHLITRSQPFCT